MLTTIALAFTGPVVVAPAMNPWMYSQETTQSALSTLSERGVVVVEPDAGDVACGENGQGKLASIESITGAVVEVAARKKSLAGKHVLITSGPTQEPIDSVRYISNRSSGKMGAALARAALLMGARVTVVSGPGSTPLPLSASVIRVNTALEMLEAAKAVDQPELIIGAAAVADYRVADPKQGKIRREADKMSVELVKNPDVIAELAHAFPNAAVIGFAAEPDEGLDHARAKLARKCLRAIAVNDISRPDIGFGSDRNELRLLFEDGRVLESGQRSKLGCALWLLEQMA